MLELLHQSASDRYHDVPARNTMHKHIKYSISLSCLQSTRLIPGIVLLCWYRDKVNATNSFCDKCAICIWKQGRRRSQKLRRQGAYRPRTDVGHCNGGAAPRTAKDRARGRCGRGLPSLNGSPGVSPGKILKLQIEILHSDAFSALSPVIYAHRWKPCNLWGLQETQRITEKNWGLWRTGA